MTRVKTTCLPTGEIWPSAIHTNFMRRIGVDINPETLAPRYAIDTYETNVPGLFVAGGQVAGKRTGTVFIENGRFHGELIAKTLASRLRS